MEEFKQYYKGLADLHSYFKSIGLKDDRFSELDDVEEYLIKSYPSHRLEAER
jgi:hypothetical protein